MSNCIAFDYTTESLIEKYEDGFVLLLVVEETLKDNKYYNFSVSMPSEENAGFDLISAEDHGSVGAPHLLDLGVRAMMVDIETRKPVHYWLLPRSSIYKTGYMMANSVGVIDLSYRGILKAPVLSMNAAAKGFQRGERYFQIVAPNMGAIRAVRICTSLPATERGEGGFGSTGTA
jgi:dUTP pyrophosphatase